MLLTVKHISKAFIFVLIKKNIAFFCNASICFLKINIYLITKKVFDQSSTVGSGLKELIQEKVNKQSMNIFDRAQCLENFI